GLPVEHEACDDVGRVARRVDPPPLADLPQLETARTPATLAAVLGRELDEDSLDLLGRQREDAREADRRDRLLGHHEDGLDRRGSPAGQLVDVEGELVRARRGDVWLGGARREVRLGLAHVVSSWFARTAASSGGGAAAASS